MTIALDSPPQVADVVDHVRAMAPDIAARAAEIEAARRVPTDLLESLKAAGCFRLLLPASHGGAECELGVAMQVAEELSRADASVGWIVVLGSGIWLDLAGLPRTTFDAMYPPGGNTIAAGAFNPTGVAVPVDGGYLVNGRWSFASGCEHADWLYGNCVDTSSGEPQLRIAVFEPSEVEIEDTWTVSGLCGSGSHHFSVRDLIVPAERTYNVFADEHCVDTPLVHIPVPATFALAFASVPIGIAQGALDDVVALATDKVPLLSPGPLGTNPLFQHQLAEADVKLRAARALLYAEAAEAWAIASAGEELTVRLRARIRSAAVFAATTAAAVVESAYRAGGGSSLYAASPLQRRLRDVNAVNQHFLLKPDTLTTCGALMAGQEPDITIF
jgi:alkylation response protein AidB-like acyl-CoA dehydrogenase